MNPSRWVRPLVVVAVLALLVAAGAWGVQQWRKPDGSSYLTEPVRRGDIVETVSANGTLDPVVLISVGTQVSGTAVSVRADFNDTVEEGQVLVELDPAAFEARVRQARAALGSALASHELAQANARRSGELFEKGYIARQDLDQTRQALKSAEAQVEQARAQMADAEVDRRNAVIRSPISGVVVARTVEQGQTVAASFQTPELFKIAGDLRRMLIHTTFAEADVGHIQPQMAARFTVDAYPDREFDGVVRQVRLNPTVNQNVVTYDVVVDVDNEDLALLPGMTAYVNVVTSRSDDVLQVPNSALRFRPQNAAGPARGASGSSGRGGPRTAVHVVRNGQLQAVPVRTGRSDGRYTEVSAETLKEGDDVVVGDRNATSNPNAQRPMRMRMF